MGYTVPMPQQGPAIGDQLALALASMAAAKHDKERRAYEKSKMEHDLATMKFQERQQKQKETDDEFGRVEHDALSLISHLTGMPAPVNDVSNGVSDVQGIPQGDALARFATGGENGMGRTNMSNAVPVGRLPIVKIPLRGGGSFDYQLQSLEDQMGQRAKLQAMTDTAKLKLVTDEAVAKRQAVVNNPLPTKDAAPTAAGLAVAEASGDPKALAALKLMRPPSTGGGGGIGDPGSRDDAKEIAAAIIRGEQPPDMKGLYGAGKYVRAELARHGYDLTTATTDWTATQRYLASVNSTTQTRLRQAVSTAYDSLDVIDDLAGKWKGGKFPLLNKASLAAAKQGIMGPEAQSLATQLEGQITDVVSELGQAYMGGTSPTDHALKLAAKNLSADWSEKTLKDMTALARKNLEIRRNSIIQSGPILGGGKTAEPALTKEPPSGSTVIVNKKTGERMYSVDGGVTWLPLK